MSDIECKAGQIYNYLSLGVNVNVAKAEAEACATQLETERRTTGNVTPVRVVEEEVTDEYVYAYAASVRDWPECQVGAEFSNPIGYESVLVSDDNSDLAKECADALARVTVGKNYEVSPIERTLVADAPKDQQKNLIL